MSGLALLAPVPALHLEQAFTVQEQHKYVLFGSNSWDVLSKIDVGAKLLIYVSHSDADSFVTFQGSFQGLVEDPSEMRRLEKLGLRPASTLGEQWGFYWKAADISKLVVPIPLSEIQLPSGKYLKGVPRGPVQVVS